MGWQRLVAGKQVVILPESFGNTIAATNGNGVLVANRHTVLASDAAKMVITFTKFHFLVDYYQQLNGAGLNAAGASQAFLLVQ